MKTIIRLDSMTTRINGEKKTVYSVQKYDGQMGMVSMWDTIAMDKSYDKMFKLFNEYNADKKINLLIK